jgi:hypothetical protein
VPIRLRRRGLEAGIGTVLAFYSGDPLAALSPFLMCSCGRLTNPLICFLLPLAFPLRQSRTTINRLRQAVFSN